ncbi:MAG: SET domain-containing protein [Minisyncoccia bacterium]
MDAESDYHLKIKKSKIAGNGVFATKKIKKGKTIIFLNGEICSSLEISKRIIKNEEAPSDPLQIDEKTYIDLNEISRTFNHSCSPNAFIKGKNELVALKDISKGEEITYDYSTTMDEKKSDMLAPEKEFWVCNCHCGSINCRKKIDQFKTLPKELKKYYLKNKLVPDFILKKYAKFYKNK